MHIPNGTKLPEGTVANATDVGYDILDKDGDFVSHVTTGDVRCDIGVCNHPEHQQL